MLYKRKAVHVEAYRFTREWWAHSFNSTPPPQWLENLPIFIAPEGYIELCRGSGLGLVARRGDWFVLERNKISVYSAEDFKEMFDEDSTKEVKQDQPCDGVPVKSDSTAIRGTTWDRRTNKEFSYVLKVKLEVYPSPEVDGIPEPIPKEFEWYLGNAVRCTVAHAMSLLER